MTQLPHISNPIDEIRRRINDANHHAYRAGYQDTAYELQRAVDKLNESLRLIQDVQETYDFAHPSRINTALDPLDPSLMPPERGDE